MSRANDSAYPIQESDLSGSIPAQHGLTIREHFAVSAPPNPQPWFRPTMPAPRPKYPKWSSIEDENVREDVRLSGECGTDPATPEGSAFIEHQGEVASAIDAWDREYERQRYIQWPAAWADALIAELAKQVQP